MEKLEKKHLLPDLSSFHGHPSFAEVSLGWDRGGLYVLVNVKGNFDHPGFPDLIGSDSIELFFDTRDVKTTGFTNRFSHHFFFLPEPIEVNSEWIQAGELTHFRTEDRHELCDPASLKIEKKKGIIKIFIPSESLHGYDPTQFGRLGFTYRINRKNGSKQNFSASDADFSIESQPSLWSSLKLIP